MYFFFKRGSPAYTYIFMYKVVLFKNDNTAMDLYLVGNHKTIIMYLKRAFLNQLPTYVRTRAYIRNNFRVTRKFLITKFDRITPHSYGMSEKI